MSPSDIEALRLALIKLSDGGMKLDADLSAAGINEVLAVIRSAILEEREACAKVADERGDKWGDEPCCSSACSDIVDAIRARSIERKEG